MKTQEFNARQEILKYGKAFATYVNGYELIFQPHMLGSMVRVNCAMHLDDSLRGDWLLADTPTAFVFALGHAAKKLNTMKKVK